MSTSTHKAEVVPVILREHPNADSLSIVDVFGYTYVARTEDWAGVTRAAYIPPDNVVEVTRPEFAWLAPASKDGRTHRVRAKKLRGVVSFGLMVPVPGETAIGEDWAERLGVVPYEPPENVGAGSENAPGPPVYHVRYDLESLRRYPDLMPAGTPVIVAEKLNGANARYVYYNNQMYCGSHGHWKREGAGGNQKKNMWWDVLERTPQLEQLCRANPGTVFYGEIFGQVGGMKYGLDRPEFAGFDVLRDGKWLGPQEALDLFGGAGVAAVPVLNAIVPARRLRIELLDAERPTPWYMPMTYDFEEMCILSEGSTLVPTASARSIREGIVITPIQEMFDDRVSRVKFKLVSPTYLERS